MAIDLNWGLDDMPADVMAFAEAVGDAFDPWQVVTPKDAAEAAGVDAETASRHIGMLKARKCWPYRGVQWRAEMAREGRLGPFGRRCGEWGRRAG